MLSFQLKGFNKKLIIKLSFYINYFDNNNNTNHKEMIIDSSRYTERVFWIKYPRLFRCKPE